MTRARAVSNGATTKGDIVAGSGTNTSAVLGVGANDTVLTADSTTATGLKWASVGGGSTEYTLLNAGGTALTGATTVTVSGISGIQKLLIYINGASSANNYSFIGVRFNGNTSSVYQYNGNRLDTGGAGFVPTEALNDNILVGRTALAATVNSATVTVDGCKSAGLKVFDVTGGCTEYSYNTKGYFNSTSTISSVSIVSSSGNLDAGTVYIYGSSN